MYRNRKRSENDQYNETSNHIQMKGGGAGGGGLGPRALWPGGPAAATAAVPFHLSMVWCLIVLIVFTSFSISIHFILCFQCVFDLYFSDWVIQGGPAAAKKYWFFGLGLKRGPPAAKNQVFLIFRLLLNAFWHADLRELVESFRNHQ